MAAERVDFYSDEEFQEALQWDLFGPEHVREHESTEEQQLNSKEDTTP